MGHAENKLKWCLKKAEKYGKEHRGLKKIEPSAEAADEHIEKALHNLSTMQYLMEGGFSDWAVNAGFYSMYHCLLAILAKHGYESRNQECTFACIEVLIEEKKASITLEQLKRLASFDEEPKKDEIIKMREEFQYGTKTILEEKMLNKLLDVSEIANAHTQGVLTQSKQAISEHDQKHAPPFRAGCF